MISAYGLENGRTFRRALDTGRILPEGTVWIDMLHPTEEAQASYVASQLSEKNAPGVLVSVSDYVKLGADGLNGHLDRKLWTLGTDGFGRSEAREELRDFFEVDARHVTLATLYALQQGGKVRGDVVAKAIADLGIDPERDAPVLR